MHNLIYADKAEKDLNDIESFIGKDNPIKAYEFVLFLNKEIAKLKDFPLLGTKEYTGTNKLPNSRRYIIKDYIVHYTILEKEQIIYITRVIHAAKQNYKLI